MQALSRYGIDDIEVKRWRKCESMFELTITAVKKTEEKYISFKKL